HGVCVSESYSSKFSPYHSEIINDSWNIQYQDCLSDLNDTNLINYKYYNINDILINNGSSNNEKNNSTNDISAKNLSQKSKKVSFSSNNSTSINNMLFKSSKSQLQIKFSQIYV